MNRLILSIILAGTLLFLTGCSDKQKIQELETNITTKKNELQELQSKQQELPKKIIEAEKMIQTYNEAKTEAKNMFDELVGQNDYIKIAVYCTLKEIDPVVSATTGFLTNNQDKFMEGLVCGMASFLPYYDKVKEKVSSYYEKVKSADKQISEVEKNLSDYKAELADIQNGKIATFEQEIAELQKKLECQESFFCRMFN